RVVHTSADATDPGEGLGAQTSRVLLARDVTLDTQRLCAERLDLLDCGLRVGDVRHHDPGALGRHAETVGTADALGASRDDDHFVLESHGSASRVAST